ncbi:hypothetical protein CFP56_033118 [Quercus suber]|uniref:Glycine-rich protein n=1 Tax=Quercus suber TaxID=58331 RepID=A0AAW0JH42_QUESU
MMSGFKFKFKFKFNDNDGLALAEADNNIIALELTVELQLILLLPSFFSLCLCLITSSGKPSLVRIGLSALINSILIDKWPDGVDFFRKTRDPRKLKVIPEDEEEKSREEGDNEEEEEEANKGLLWKLPQLSPSNWVSWAPPSASALAAVLVLASAFLVIYLYKIWEKGDGMGVRSDVMLSFLFLSPHYSGAGFGPGIPGLHVGIGIGAGCGVGLGFGYGVGKGIALDENRRYSNVGHLSRGPINFPSQDEIGALVDELIINTKKVIRATSREIDKWRR